jgi:DNA-binding NarL/FixJ family response regulator
MPQHSEAIRLALVDDHAIVRQGLASMLREYSQVELLIIANNGQDFLAQLAQQPIDIVLLDIEMPQLNGVETLQQLSTHYPDVKAIMLSMHDDPEIALECLRLGAASYLLKECSLSEMMEAITQVQQNGAYQSAFAESAFASKKHHINGLQQMQLEKGFSDRDLKVLQLLCDGFTSKHIAEQIHVSKKTVDLIRTKLLKAYQVKTSNELMRLSILDGFYKPRTNEEIQAEKDVLLQEKLERRKARYI